VRNIPFKIQPIKPPKEKSEKRESSGFDRDGLTDQHPPRRRIINGGGGDKNLKRERNDARESIARKTPIS
jgi:hypothetical protein